MGEVGQVSIVDVGLSGIYGVDGRWDGGYFGIIGKND